MDNKHTLYTKNDVSNNITWISGNGEQKNS